MNDLISRSALIEELQSKPSYRITGPSGVGKVLQSAVQYHHDEIIKIINNQPTVEAKPVVRGRWEQYPSAFYRRCSACKTEYELWRIQFSKYCPNCGADMRGGKNE